MSDWGYRRFLLRLLRPSKKYCTGTSSQRKLIKRAGGYAIGGPFVFLQLLKRNPDRWRKLCLRHARFQPPQAQSRSNVAINGVRKTV